MGLFNWPDAEKTLFSELSGDLKNGRTPLKIKGCMVSQRAHLINELGKGYPRLIVVAPDDVTAREMFDDLSQFEKNVLYYPAKDVIFYQADMSGGIQLRQRIGVMKHLSEEEEGTIVTTFSGLMNIIPDFTEWKNAAFRLESGSIVMTEALAGVLTRNGYTRRAVVSEPGEFAVRGDITDIYPFTDDNPVRVELFGDEVDSIREFDVESQRTIRQVESVDIYPACEFLLSEKERAEGLARIKKDYEKAYGEFKAAGDYDAALNLRQGAGLFIEQLDSGMIPFNLYSYLPYFDSRRGSLLNAAGTEGTLIVMVDAAGCVSAGQAVWDEWEASCGNRLKKGYMLPGQQNVLIPAKALLPAVKKYPLVMCEGAITANSGIRAAKEKTLMTGAVGSYRNNVEMLISDLKRWKREKRAVVLLYSSRSKAERMADYLYDTGVNPVFAERGAGNALPGQTLVTVGKLHKGFSYAVPGLVVLTETDVNGVSAAHKKRYNYKGQGISSLAELKIGDYVVHETYGLGRYRGIEKMIEGRSVRDYIRVEYGDDSSLYIPAMQFDLIQKYAAPGKENVKLSNLYGNEWKRTKARVQKAVEETAKELIELYAIRESKKGFACGPDTLYQREFEESFPYDETQDQIDAIADVKKDMESEKIMDRLICGDVGFGKTEIALRAAFKAAMAGKQVVFLVPTTILCQQHYTTFSSRLAEYPIRVDMLSRFCTPAQVRQTLADLKEGTVDILIGTHRVLSQDVSFRDLGLLIIDEEQRFGVKHKEKIKQLKKDIDVLTLTATPIPRTLHMSLIGVRDMSSLSQPPRERLPIQTYVSEYSDEMVREAVTRELARGGQVYYVYNRVMNIASETEALRELLPDARIEFAHGQMSERTLERIMYDFVSGEIDVLVSTTIIETGLDIPNVNTIIIRNAERFGLSQLYQLRGRVGRSNRVSYAFVMYNGRGELSETAARRLEAIRQFTELGSGVRIAKEDLEIRGAGNILGTRQHGHMEEVGYDLYCKMLGEAVGRLKGEETEQITVPAKLNMQVEAYIPRDYIENEGLMLDIYKRIADIRTEEDRMDMTDELIDRFGDIPGPCLKLLELVLIKTMAGECGICEVTAEGEKLTLTFSESAPLDPQRLPELVGKYKGRLSVRTRPKVCFVYLGKKSPSDEGGDMCESLKRLLTDIKMLLVERKGDIVS